MKIALNSRIGIYFLSWLIVFGANGVVFAQREMDGSQLSPKPSKLSVGIGDRSKINLFDLSVVRNDLDPTMDRKKAILENLQILVQSVLKEPERFSFTGSSDIQIDLNKRFRVDLIPYSLKIGLQEPTHFFITSSVREMNLIYTVNFPEIVGLKPFQISKDEDGYLFDLIETTMRMMNGNELELLNSYRPDPTVLSRSFWKGWEEDEPITAKRYRQYIYPAMGAAVESVAKHMNQERIHAVELFGGHGLLMSQVTERLPGTKYSFELFDGEPIQINRAKRRLDEDPRITVHEPIDLTRVEKLEPFLDKNIPDIVFASGGLNNAVLHPFNANAVV